MYKAITLLFLFLCSMHLNAQYALNKPYKIYLRDSLILSNKVIRGELISYEDDFIELKLLDGKIEKILTRDIYNILPFRKPFPKISNYNKFDDFPNGTSYRIRGSYLILLMTFSPDHSPEKTGEDTFPKASFTIINGYQFLNGNAIGIGTNFSWHKSSFVPVFIDYRFYLFRSPISVFTSANLGYAFSFEQIKGSPFTSTEGGLMYQAGAGFTIATKHKSNIILEVARRNQFAKIEELGQSTLQKHRFKDFVFQVGFTF